MTKNKTENNAQNETIKASKNVSKNNSMNSSKNNLKSNEPKKKLPLSSDIVFKRVFSKEENKDMLKSLLEAILKIKIEEIVVKNPELTRELAGNKAGTLDIKAQIDENTIIDIEMQVEDEKNIEKRATYYMVKVSSDEVKKGTNYEDIKDTIIISILNFNYFKTNYFHNIAHLTFDEQNKDAYVDMGYKEEEKRVTDMIEMHFIELPKFKMKNEDPESNLNKWLWLILGEEEKVKMAKKQVKEINKAIKVIDTMSMDSKEWELYDSRERALVNYNSGMIRAKKIGREEGRTEGRKEGREEGKRQEKMNIAKKLLKLKIPIEQIIESTDLEEEEILKLKEEENL